MYKLWRNLCSYTVSTLHLKAEIKTTHQNCHITDLGLVDPKQTSCVDYDTYAYCMLNILTLILFKLTSTRRASFSLILFKLSSTLVGFGGSSNTGRIFSPLTTSVGTNGRARVDWDDWNWEETHLLGHLSPLPRSYIQHIQSESPFCTTAERSLICW